MLKLQNKSPIWSHFRFCERTSKKNKYFYQSNGWKLHRNRGANPIDVNTAQFSTCEHSQEHNSSFVLVEKVRSSRWRRVQYTAGLTHPQRLKIGANMYVKHTNKGEGRRSGLPCSVLFINGSKKELHYSFSSSCRLHLRPGREVFVAQQSKCSHCWDPLGHGGAVKIVQSRELLGERPHMFSTKTMENMSYVTSCLIQRFIL